ncbi:MAG: Hsp20/alpha crystallin family protein [Calothrix sp. C42_A2020_038]|nr:Hsp20/alpha crystallin family protein [Calothrix sp. C42_A2020_038]
MSLIPWQPLKELNTLRQQINRLLDEFMHGEQAHSSFTKLENITWTPAIELKESETDVILKIQVPGIDPKDLDIQVSENAIAVAGEYQEEKVSDSKGFYRSEFSYGNFQRIIPLPVEVKHEEVKAEVKDGIVTLTLPKSEKSHRNIVKVDLNVSEKAREAMAQERLHNEHLQQTMHERAASELDTRTYSNVDEEARNAMTEQRLNEEHIQETMHSRAKTELGADN